MSREIRQRIRPTKDSLSNGISTTASRALDEDYFPPIHLPTIGWPTITIHVFAVLLFLSGYILRISFHSGEECEMTWSMRHFLLLPETPPHPVYRLFKFTDRKDPRQLHLYTSNIRTNDEWSQCASSDWCTSPKNATTTIVLYVPGHWGSFSQARSLGAHGLQWTHEYSSNYQQLGKQQHALRVGDWNGSSRDLSSFVYDVYAIDFGQQGGGLHGNLLYAQSDYVAQVVMTLVNKCRNPSIMIVGHSVGGLVARSVPVLYPHTREYISNLVTLATPHWRFPYCFDESLDEFYQLLDTKEDIPLVSIAGGIRDEMIPPKACHHKGGVSVLANDIALPSPGTFGMDHRAIVWCHNLLARVRAIIHVMVVEKNPEQRQSKLRSLLQVEDYSKAVAVQEEAFRKRYGFWKSTAMKSAMLYHKELLLGLYAVTAGLYHALPELQVVAVPLAVVAVGVWRSDIDLISVLITLALVANTIHWILRSILTKLAWHKHKKPPHVRRFVLIFLLVQLGVASVGYMFFRQSVVLLPLLPAVFVSLILLLPVVALSMLQEVRDVMFVSLLLPVLPCLVAGKFYMTAWSILEPFPSMMSLVWFLVKVGLPVYLRLLCPRAPWYEPRRVFACALAILVYSRSMLRVGGGFTVGHFLACLAWIDVVFFAVGRFMWYWYGQWGNDAARDR